MLKSIPRKLGELAYRTAGMLGYPPEMWSAIGGKSFAVSAAGRAVNQDTALRVAAYKRAVSLVSDYVGKTPFHVKRGYEKAKDHPAWPLCRKWSIHHVQSAGALRRALVVHAMLSPCGAAWIRRDADMRPIELRLLPMRTVWPVRVNNQLRYQIQGRKNTLSPSDMIVIHGFGVDGFSGLDPIKTYARDVLGLSIAQQDYASGYYAQGGSPNTYAHSEHVLSDDQYNQVFSRLNEKGGLANAMQAAHEIPLCEGFELKSLGLSAEETQLLGSREFSLKDIANLTGVPVHKLMGDGKSSYKSLEEENRSFREDTLDPWFCQLEEQYSKLLTEDEQADDSVTVEAVRESLNRTNQAERANVLSKAIGGPWMTPNQGREVESMPPLPGGDELLKPLNMTPDTEPSDDTEPTDSRSQLLQRAEPTRLESQLTGPAVGLLAQYDLFADALTFVSGRRSRDFPDWLAKLPHGEFRADLQRVYDTATPEEFPQRLAAVCTNHLKRFPTT